MSTALEKKLLSKLASDENIRLDSFMEMALLDHCVREHLNKPALRRMAVLNPLKVVIDNYPAGEAEDLDAVNCGQADFQEFGNRFVKAIPSSCCPDFLEVKDCNF